MVGVDIPVSAIQALEPRRALGPSGYTFAVNQVSVRKDLYVFWIGSTYLAYNIRCFCSNFASAQNDAPYNKRRVIGRDASFVCAKRTG